MSAFFGTGVVVSIPKGKWVGHRRIAKHPDIGPVTSSSSTPAGTTIRRQRRVRLFPGLDKKAGSGLRPKASKAVAPTPRPLDHPLATAIAARSAEAQRRHCRGRYANTRAQTGREGARRLPGLGTVPSGDLSRASTTLLKTSAVTWLGHRQARHFRGVPVALGGWRRLIFIRGWWRSSTPPGAIASDRKGD